MTAISASPLLHRALLLDAVATGATALLVTVGAGVLADPLGLPQGLLRGAGLVLSPFVGFVSWTATRESPPARAVRAIIGLNAAWVVASVMLLVSGWVDPTPLGHAFVIAQALAVGVFAESQVIGLRRARAAIA